MTVGGIRLALIALHDAELAAEFDVMSSFGQSEVVEYLVGISIQRAVRGSRADVDPGILQLDVRQALNRGLGGNEP